MSRLFEKRILIVSGGREAVPIIERAIARGLYVIVSDGDEHAPGLAIAHEALVASTYDAETTLRLARRVHEKNPIHGVLAAASDVPLTVATVASGLGLAGPSLETARIASDKFLMKEALRKAGVAVPWYAMVGSPDELRTLMKAQRPPLVIKPVDSRGARGVVRVTEDIDPAWAFHEARRNSPRGRVMVEEWVDGMQVSTESVVAGGEVATPGLSERNYEYLDRFAPYVIENGGDLPAPLSPEQREAIDRVILTASSAIGLSDWTLKGDLVMTSDGPVVIEVAPRLSGGFFCTHTIPLSSGVSIVDAALLLALGRKVRAGDFRPCKARPVSQRFWFAGPGRVREIDVPGRIHRMPGLEMMSIHVREGEYLGPVVSHPGRAGMVIARGSTQEEASMRAREAINAVGIYTEEVEKRLV